MRYKHHNLVVFVVWWLLHLGVLRQFDSHQGRLLALSLLTPNGVLFRRMLAMTAKHSQQTIKMLWLYGGPLF